MYLSCVVSAAHAAMAILLAIGRQCTTYVRDIDLKAREHDSESFRSLFQSSVHPSSLEVGLE
jgi:hypothetical protein